MNSKQIEFIIKWWRLIFLIISIITGIVAFFQILLRLDTGTIKITSLTSLSFLLVVTFYSFFKFFTSEERMMHEIKDGHGSLAISSFYGIYFPIVMFSFLIQVLLIFNGRALFDSTISPMGNIVYIIPTFVVAIGIIAIADHEMREKGLNYSLPSGQKSFGKSFFYGLPIVGLYFGLITFFNFILTAIVGNSIKYSSLPNPYSIDSSIIYVAKAWTYLSKMEKTLLPFAFVFTYISVEVFLRGYIANFMKSLDLGTAGFIFIPAVIQAAAFSSGVLLFSNPFYYLYRFIEALLFGIILGIIFWRTKKFSITVIMALLMRFLDNGSQFFRVVMLSMPKSLGVYDLNSPIVTPVEKIASMFIYTKIFLMVIAPFILLIAYDEVIAVVKGIWINFKRQWFGYIIIALAFIIIDLVFSFLFGDGFNIIYIVFGYLIAMFIIRYLIKALFSVLPKLTSPLIIKSDNGLLSNSYPLNVVNDIKWIENSKPWFNKSKEISIAASSIYIYFLFIAAAYRQYRILDVFDSIKFTVFLVLLPAILLGLSTYLLIDRYRKGFFFQETWRTQIYIFLIIIYVYNVLTWTSSGALANFSWRNIPFFVFYALLIYPRDISKPFRDIAIGFARDGRHATFRWLQYDSTKFEEALPMLLSVESDVVNSATYIMCAKLNIMDEMEYIDILRTQNLRKGEIVGRILALGIFKSQTSEGVLLNYLANEDIDIKMAAYWSLGEVGSVKVLSRMAQVIEENPRKELIKVAQRAILKIDPMYPLAGLRDQVIMA